MLENIEKFLVNVRNSCLMIYRQRDLKNQWYYVAEMQSALLQIRCDTKGGALELLRVIRELNSALTFVGGVAPHEDNESYETFDRHAYAAIIERDGFNPIRCAYLGMVGETPHLSCFIGDMKFPIAIMVGESLFQALSGALYLAAIGNKAAP